MQCKYCGCTDDRACDGGCEWVADRVCSACVVSVPKELLAELLTIALRTAKNEPTPAAAKEATRQYKKLATAGEVPTYEEILEWHGELILERQILERAKRR